MRVQSIRAMIQIRHIAGNRLFCLAVKMTFREMHAITESHYLPQEVRAMAEALQYSRHLLPARLRAPFVIDFRDLTSRICVFNKIDLVLHFLLHHRFASLVIFLALVVQNEHKCSADCVSAHAKRFAWADSVVVLPILYREERQSQGFINLRCSAAKRREMPGGV
jgi:hypothetical protein